MPDVLQTVPDSKTITIKTNMRFQIGICTEKVQLDQIQMVDRSFKPCQIAKSLLCNKMCGFRSRYALKNLDQVQNDRLEAVI